MKAIVFHHHPGNVVTVEEPWPMEVGFTLELLVTADRKFMWVRGERIDIEAANGKATYRVYGYEAPGVLLCELEEADWQPTVTFRISAPVAEAYSGSQPQ